MRVLVEHGRLCKVLECKDLRSLSVECVSGAVERATLLEGGLGWIDDSHAWLDVAALERICGARTREWHDGFRAMIDFARGHGWLDPTGSHVRAHIVPPNDSRRDP